MNDLIHLRIPARLAVFPGGDQPQAIEKLIKGFEAGLARQTCSA
jgi:excinuclease UvrABC helicase subunit UvrB